MAHNNHIIDGMNKDVSPLFSMEDARNDYLEMANGWEDPYGIPEVKIHDSIRVV